jgi:integrase
VKGSTFKRCTCPAKHNAKGVRINCPKKHGSWSYIADVGVDEATGKRKQAKKGGFPTQDAAQAALNELLAKLQQGTYVPDTGITVGAWLEQWIDERENANRVRDSTVTAYRSHIRLYLAPKLGRMKLRDLRPGHVQKLVDELASGRSGATVLRIHATLRSALSTAVKRQMLAMNPASTKLLELPEGARPKVTPWSPEDLGAFLDSIASHPLAALFEVIAATGLRRGEALGVRWSDIDLEAGVLTVRQQITQVHKKRAGQQPVCPVCGERHAGVGYGKPKTRSGEDRIVELDSGVLGVLLAHRLTQDAERAEWGDAYRDHDLVFSRPGGDPLQPKDITDLFGELVDAAGLRRIRLHDLRHGHASLMLASGTDMSVVSKRIGHSTITLTVDTYSHLLEGVGRQAAEKAAALVPRKSRDQSVTNQTPAAGSAAETAGESAGQGSSVGGARGTRTHNPRIKSPLLCQLS